MSLGKVQHELYIDHSSPCFLFWLFIGTYNNQYMVLDLKQVQLKEPLLKGTLWVVEQIPGYVVMIDM